MIKILFCLVVGILYVAAINSDGLSHSEHHTAKRAAQPIFSIPSYPSYSPYSPSPLTWYTLPEVTPDFINLTLPGLPYRVLENCNTHVYEVKPISYVTEESLEDYTPEDIAYLKAYQDVSVEIQFIQNDDGQNIYEAFKNLLLVLENSVDIPLYFAEYEDALIIIFSRLGFEIKYVGSKPGNISCSNSENTTCSKTENTNYNNTGNTNYNNTGNTNYNNTGNTAYNNPENTTYNKPKNTTYNS